MPPVAGLVVEGGAVLPAAGAVVPLLAAGGGVVLLGAAAITLTGGCIDVFEAAAGAVDVGAGGSAALVIVIDGAITLGASAAPISPPAASPAQAKSSRDAETKTARRAQTIDMPPAYAAPQEILGLRAEHRSRPNYAGSPHVGSS